MLVLVIATKKNEAGSPLFVSFLKNKNLSGHTAELLLVVARKQTNEAGSPLFVLFFKNKNLSGHTAVLL